MALPTWRAVCAFALLASPALAQTYASATVPTGLTDVGFMAAPAILDVDEDGDPDVIVGRADGTFAYFENTGSATAPAFAEVTGAANPLDGITVPAAATVAVDENRNLILGGIDGQFVTVRNDGPSATPQFVVASSSTVLLDNTVFAVGDLDLDGTASVVTGDATGGLALGGSTALDAVDVGWSAAPAIGDFDGDTDLDLLVGDVDGNLAFIENTAGIGATPVYAAPVDNVLGFADVGYGAVPTVGDLDGDGDPDVLVGTSDGTFAYFENIGSGLTASLPGTGDAWRMVTSPVATATVDDLLDSIWTQGITGADVSIGAPNVFRHAESAPGGINDGYTAVGTMAEAVGAGVGLYVYVFEDDDFSTAAVDGGFPKTLDVPAGALQTTAFTWGAGADGPLTYTDNGAPPSPGAQDPDGWNLLGNPFAGWFSWDATTDTGVDDVVYVFDGASYRVWSRGLGGTLPGGVIGAFQGFMVQTSADSPTLTANPTPSDGGPLYRSEAAPMTLELALRPAGDGTDAEITAGAFVALGVDGAEEGRDSRDGWLLTPPNAAYALLGTRAGDAALALDARPEPSGPVEIDLIVALVGVGTDQAVLSWPALENLPDDWQATLVDRETGAETDLRTQTEVTLTVPDQAATRVSLGDGPQTAALRSGSERYALRLGPAATVATGAVPEALALGAVYPNPTAATARAALDLPAAALVTADLFDTLGRRVAVVAEGQMPAGQTFLDIDVAGLGAGVYVLRVRVGTETLARQVVVTR